MGLKITFSTKPVQTKIPQKRTFSAKEVNLLSREITKLQNLGAVQECYNNLPDQFISTYFLTNKSNGNKRFILNLKKLNTFIKTSHFKMEDFRTVSRILLKDMFMTSIDLKDAYFLIPVDEKYSKYLRFIFNDTLYEFTCLPFGISSAPYIIFTKITKPVTTYLRKLGILCVAYLDDFPYSRTQPSTNLFRLYF